MLSPAEQIPSVIELLNELSEDNSIPKNVKVKLHNVAVILKNGEEPSTKANKALQELDEINEDTNLQQYIRTQLWNIVSILSKIN